MQFERLSSGSYLRLLHSQHVSEDILQWSIHGRYYTDDIHTYQQIGLLFGLKMQGPLADVEEHILSKGFRDLGLAAKLLNRRILQDYTIIEVLIDFCMLAHARSIPISANQHIADVVATLFAGCLLQKRGQYLYCMTQPKRWCMLISFPVQILCVSNKIVPVLGEVWTRVRKLCEDRVLTS